MDTKKKIMSRLLITFALFFCGLAAYAQTPDKLKFCDRVYEYGKDNDRIKLFFNLYDEDGKTLHDVSPKEFEKFFSFYEDGEPVSNYTIEKLNSGIRLPKEYTFSILLDRSIPRDGKTKILGALKSFIEMAPDSCIYISTYGEGAGLTRMVTKGNFSEIENEFMTPTYGEKKFYSGVYAKLAEFSNSGISLADVIPSGPSYTQNPDIAARAKANPGKNILIIFAEGSNVPDIEELDYRKVKKLQSEHSSELPKVYGLYYSAGEDIDDDKIPLTLDLLSHPKDTGGNPILDLQGRMSQSSNIEEVLASFQNVVEESAYGYSLSYTANSDRTYTGKVDFEAKWGKDKIGEATFTIGSVERPWPEREVTPTNLLFQLLIALLVTLITILFYFLVMRIVVPWIRSLTFKRKYYKKYQPEANVSRRICHYCKQDLRPGQTIVTKCTHWMHKHCWEENEYKCAEYGQNCKDGIQDHIEWKEMFKMRSLRDSSQTIAGVLAGLISWIIYELCGRGAFFNDLAEWIVGIAFGGESGSMMFVDCVARTASFLTIGMLLGFFLSIVFRFKDDIKRKTFVRLLRIFLLSVFTAAVGFLSFAIGAWIFCLIVKATGETFIPWYCSLPAYVLFSICVSLSLAVMSSIPLKSALLGGCISAIIGFLVLYFTKFTNADYEWLNMLLDFIIYGGGLGASLVTVRMLAEKYFLVIQNGVKAGQRIPIHKWMNATGGGNKVSIGMTGECEIQMFWEKSNKVAKEHAKLYINHERNLPVIKPLATGVIYNNRAEIPMNRESVLTNGDTFRIGDTIFKYEEL